jgi:ATP-dependent Clp endopeptidase proteolytic subunit ClpP
MTAKKKTAQKKNVSESGPQQADVTILSTDVESSLEKLGVYLLMSEINSDSVKPVIEWILKNNLMRTPIDKLSLVINSGGGSVGDAFALIDTMKGSAIPVHTIGLGEISSAALMIFMAGHKGKRVMTPNASILSHQYSWGRWGKEHELINSSRAIDLTSEMILTHYKKCTGLTENKIRTILLPPTDVWLSAKEAKKYGLCDKVKEMY